MASIKDIAKKAGVSIATVSHVIHKTRYVSPELVERVEEAIRNADTLPRFLVRKQEKIRQGLINNEKNTILYVCQDQSDSFVRGIRKKLKESLYKENYAMIRLECDSEVEINICQSLLNENKNLVGLFVSVRNEGQYLKNLVRSNNLPCIVIGNVLDDTAFDRVTTNIEEGAYEATMHCIRNGHEKIALLLGDSLGEYSKSCVEGYKKALSDSGLEIKQSYILKRSGTKVSLANLLNGVLKKKERPTALFISNPDDVYAVYRYLIKRNIQCPDDLSIICFGNRDSFPFLNPALSAVEHDFEKLAEESVKLMMEKLNLLRQEGKAEGLLKKSVKKEILPKIALRESTKGEAKGPLGEKRGDIQSLVLTEREMDLCRAKRYTAVIVYHYMGASFMKLHEQGIRDVFDRLGITIIAVMGCQMDFTLQMKQIQSLLMLDPDIMIAFPVSHNLTYDIFKNVAKTRTKLIFMGHVPDGLGARDYVSCINVNERSNGRNIGRGLGDYLLLHHRKNVGIIRYGHQFYTTNQRDDAVEQVIREEYPELFICAIESFSRGNEYEKTKELLKMHPEIEGIYVSWEGPARQVVDAIYDTKREDIAVVTSDLDFFVALDMAKDGCIKALSAQKPFEEGQATALCAANALLGKEVPLFVAVEPIFVTAENLIKSWHGVYKDEIPQEIMEALEQNVQFMME